MLYARSLLVIHLKYSSVYMSIPNLTYFSSYSLTLSEHVENVEGLFNRVVLGIRRETVWESSCFPASGGNEGLLLHVLGVGNVMVAGLAGGMLILE